MGLPDFEWSPGCQAPQKGQGSGKRRMKDEKMLEMGLYLFDHDEYDF